MRVIPADSWETAGTGPVHGHHFSLTRAISADPASSPLPGGHRHDQGIALAAATAQRRHTSTAPAPGELEGQG